MNRWNTPDGQRPKFREFDLIWDLRTDMILLLRLCSACHKGLLLPWISSTCAKNKSELRCKSCAAEAPK